MYLYFAAKIRKSIHIMAYQCIKNKKWGRRSLLYTKRSFNIYEKKRQIHIYLFLQSN